MLIVTSKETLTYALFDCYVGKFDCFKLCLGFLVDENTVNTWMPCGVEAQKETIRLINIGLTIFHCIRLLRWSARCLGLYLTVTFFFAPSCPAFEC